MKGSFYFLLFLFTATQATAQYFQFSQYNYSAQRVTPTAPASSDYASLAFLYRNQGTGGDIKLNSNLFSASYPLLTRNGARRWSGVGITLMDDRSGGIFSLQEASLSYAVNIFLNRFESFSLGFKTLYQQRKIDLAGLFTGSQYVADRGFDPGLYNGESVGTFRSDYLTFSSGLAWQHVNKDGIRLAYWSVSLFDFNKPDDSFLDKNTGLPSTWVAAGGFRAFKEGNMSVFPEVLYTRNAANNVLNAGIVTRCDVKGTADQQPFHVDLLTRYVAGRSGIIGLQFHNGNFSVGLSYDFLIHRNNVANMGALEIGLELRRLVNPQPRGRITKKNIPARNQAAKPATRVQQKKPVITTAADSSGNAKVKPSLSSTLQMKRDSVRANAKAGQVSHQPFEIEKVILHFNFEFNSSDLDESSAKYLDELSGALKEDAHLRIRLAGHTDNVGSAGFNLKLSLFRANAIRDYLVSKGVDSSRIETEGKGLSEPLNDNRTESDRAKNRRVELTIFYEE
jgi:type IX secretion system PorP/SprF family membrane protein